MARCASSASSRIQRSNQANRNREKVQRTLPGCHTPQDTIAPVTHALQVPSLALLRKGCPAARPFDQAQRALSLNDRWPPAELGRSVRCLGSISAPILGCGRALHCTQSLLLKEIGPNRADWAGGSGHVTTL
jgi:hypothetical protein